MQPQCPICRRAVAAEAGTFPFCGPRCKLIDLGNWLDGAYRIPGGAADPEDLDELLDAGELERS
jgi:uncharacterized protein